HAGAPATSGEVLDALKPGAVGRYDWAARIRVRLDYGELESAEEIQVLAGANIAAVRNSAGEWEVLQFRSAKLVAPATYELTGLLRGQAGTEGAMKAEVPPGAPFMLVTETFARVELATGDVGFGIFWR